MSILERFSGVFLIAGMAFLGGAMLSLGIVPAVMVDALEPRQGLPTEVPMEFQAQYKSADEYQRGLMLGRDVYVAEACWHCHSQFVRPTANENLRYGPVSTAGEFQNVLQMPQLLGTRRVGPDLSRESGVHSNDWHVVHLYKPTLVEPQSVMPEYPWLFDVHDGVPVPNARGWGVIAFLQWLGRDYAARGGTLAEFDQAAMPPEE